MMIGDFVFEHQIGEGTFSKVHAGIHIPTGTPVAIKCVEKESLRLFDSDGEQLLRDEIRVFSQCNHPFIARFYTLIEDDRCYYIVQEMLQHGDMLHFLNSSGDLNEHLIRKYFVQLVSALDYLHNTLHVAHRDIKAENVMLDRYDNIRLIDFGLCKAHNPRQVMETQCGSPEYAAPEMVRGNRYDDSADIWSLGVLTYAMAYCRLPFQDSNINNLLHKIVYSEPAFPPTVSVYLLDLLQRMLTKDPSARITLAEIKEHPWVKDHILDSQLVELDKAMEKENVLQRVTAFGYDPDELQSALNTGKLTPGVVTYVILERQLLAEQLRTLLLTPLPTAHGISMWKSTSMPTPNAMGPPLVKLRTFQSVANKLITGARRPVPQLTNAKVRIRVRSLGADERRLPLGPERSYDSLMASHVVLPRL